MNNELKSCGNGKPTEIETGVLDKALRKWGEQAQILMAIEEMAELTHALLQYLNRAATSDEYTAAMEKIREEKADVYIMLAQMDLIFGDSGEWIEKKMERLEGMVSYD